MRKAENRIDLLKKWEDERFARDLKTTRLVADLKDKLDFLHSDTDRRLLELEQEKECTDQSLRAIKNDLFDPMGGGVHLAHFVHDLTYSDTVHGIAIIELKRKVQSLTDRLPNSKDWKEKTDKRLLALESGSEPFVTGAMVDAWAAEWFGQRTLSPGERELAREAIAAAMKAGAK